MDTASFSAWQNDAMQEPWIVAHDEIDEAPIGPFRLNLVNPSQSERSYR